MARAKRFLRIALCFALVLVLGGEVILSAFSLEASAAEATFDINTSDPLADLAGATINESLFTTSDYDPTKKSDPELILFYEYGYSPANLNHYGLYVYIFYPNGRYVSEEGNTITLNFTKESGDSFSQYPLKYLNCTKDPSKGGFFYKFKVDFTEEERKQIWYNSNNDERFYAVGEVELLDISGEQKVFAGKKYVYSGYMQGLTAESAEASTLACKTDSQETLTLDVHPTYYRFPGITNAEEKELIDRQTTLHSVYFAVPNDMIRKYGEMTAVTAAWREALLNPALVVGDEEIYGAFSTVLNDKYVLPNEWSIEKCPYYFVTDVSVDTTSATAFYGYWCNIDLNDFLIFNYEGIKQIDHLRMLYRTPSWGTDAADNYIIDRVSVHDYLLERSEEMLAIDQGAAYNLLVVDGERYHKGLFESVGKLETHKITIDEEYELSGAIVKDTWWRFILSAMTGKDLKDVEHLEEKNVQAIQKVTDVDVYGKNEEAVCNDLCIAESDYDHFKEFYDQKTREEDSTVYLFRYRTSDYYAEEAFFYKRKEVLPDDLLDVTFLTSTNGYVFQMPVDLGFDIIDVTLTKNGVDTVIPVLSEAQNIFHDVTPSLDTTSDIPFWLQEDFMMNFGLAVGSIGTIVMMVLGLVVLVVIVIALGYAWTYLAPYLQVPLNWLTSETVRIRGVYQQHKHRMDKLRKSWNSGGQTQKSRNYNGHKNQSNRRRRK